MRILITESGRYLSESADSPEVGKSYILEDATEGSQAQNRGFHSLLDAFWTWMHLNGTFQIYADGKGYDFTTPDREAFKELFKARYCAGFKHLEYVNNKYEMVRVLNTDKEVYKKIDGVKVRQLNKKDIPDYVLLDFTNGNKKRLKGVLKSWTKYTMKERAEAISILKAIIAESGCDSKKVKTILNGMEAKK